MRNGERISHSKRQNPRAIQNTRRITENNRNVRSLRQKDNQFVIILSKGEKINEKKEKKKGSIVNYYKLQLKEVD